MPAAPMPPPMHMVTIPYFEFLRFVSWTTGYRLPKQDEVRRPTAASLSAARPGTFQLNVMRPLRKSTFSSCPRRKSNPKRPSTLALGGRV
jgi:hypothetical protein